MRLKLNQIISESLILIDIVDNYCLLADCMICEATRVHCTPSLAQRAT